MFGCYTPSQNIELNFELYTNKFHTNEKTPDNRSRTKFTILMQFSISWVYVCVYILDLKCNYRRL